MNRNKKSEKSSEMQPFDEYFDELLKEMEADSEYANYTVPKDWDLEFRAAIREGLREQRKRERKLKIKRITKVTGLVAAVVVLVCTSNLTVEETQGKGLLKFFQSIFDIGNDKHVTYGTDENMSMEFPDEENGDIFFDGESLDEVFSQIRSEVKVPMFYFDDVFEEYEIKEAKYNKELNMVNVEIKTLLGKIYVSQQTFVNNNGSGVLSDAEECSEIYNENLKQNIIIYQCKSEDGYSFSIEEGILFFSIIGNMSLKECEQIAESLNYK